MSFAIGRPGWRRLITAGALSAAFVICLFVLARWVRVSGDWPTAQSDNILLIGILVVGLIPMELLLIDALIRRGGKLSLQGIEIALAGILDRLRNPPVNLAAPRCAWSRSGSSDGLFAAGSQASQASPTRGRA